MDPALLTGAASVGEVLVKALASLKGKWIRRCATLTTVVVALRGHPSGVPLQSLEALIKDVDDEQAKQQINKLVKEIRDNSAGSNTHDKVLEAAEQALILHLGCLHDGKHDDEEA